MKTVVLLLAFLLAAPSVNEARRSAQPDLYALTELARSAKPEFAAWALLEILDSGQIADQEWRSDLAREALELAGRATHGERRMLAPGFAVGYDRATRWHQAYARGLDQLTLSSRAIGHLRRHSPRAGREALQALAPAVRTTSSCKDPLVGNRKAWYDAAMALDLSSEAVLAALNNISSHTELPYAIDLIFSRHVSEWELLTGALADRLRTLPIHAREWNASAPQTARALQQLHGALEAQQLPTGPVLEGWRTWTYNALTSPACSGEAEVRELAWELFNETSDSDLPPELKKPPSTAEAVDRGAFPQNEDLRAQAAEYQRLLFGDGSRALSQAEKNTPEWRERFLAYVKKLEARTQSGDESATDYFFRQSQDWNSILIAAPPCPERDRALLQYVGFLLRSAEVIDPILFFAEIDAMTANTRSLHGAEFAKTLAAFDQSGHPALRLYARIRDRFPAAAMTALH